MKESEMGPVGRVLRILLGGYLTLIALPHYLFPGVKLTFLGSTYLSDYASVVLALTMTLGFLVFYLLLHRASTTYAKNLNEWLGASIANIPPLAVFVIAAFLGLGSMQIAVFTYVGLAMLLAGWRKDKGCEVMSPANALLGRPTHFACILFSPIDWVEKRTKSSSSRSKANSLGLPSGS
jgi:hypothetical protein